VLQLKDNLTTTADGNWVVWAFKLARVAGDRFIPLSGRGSYPAEATALCEAGSWRRHDAPEPTCTCGFHALSEGDLPGFPVYDGAALTVVLYGRILAFEWPAGGVLLRAAHQKVVRVDRHPARLEQIPAELEAAPRRPEDPEGRLARTDVGNPSGAGPVRLQLPCDPVKVVINDDAGWCRVAADGDPVGGRSELISV
jgi:hypothetical protein